jgi:glycosylphosphatidylinositol transamidase
MVGQQSMTWFMIPLIQRMIASDAGASRSTVAAAWVVFKSIICAGYGMFLLTLTTMNPSLSLLIAIPVIPTLVLVRPTQNFIVMMIQIIIFVAISPPLLLFWYALYTQDPTRPVLFMQEIYQQYESFGALFVPFISVIYWPLNLACQVIVGMEP